MPLRSRGLPANGAVGMMMQNSMALAGARFVEINGNPQYIHSVGAALFAPRGTLDHLATLAEMSAVDQHVGDCDLCGKRSRRMLVACDESYTVDVFFCHACAEGM